MITPRFLSALVLLVGGVYAGWQVEVQLPKTHSQAFDAYLDGSGLGFVVGRAGTVSRSRDSGATWESSPKATFMDLHALHATDARTVFAAGDSGTVIRTSDRGESWRQLHTGISANLRAIHFPDPSTGFAAGPGGVLIKTSDGGNQWQSLSTGFSGELLAVHFPDARTGFAAGTGETLLATADGGATWHSRPVVFASRVKDSTNRTSSVRFYEIHFFDSQHGFLSGQNSIFHGSGKHGTWFNFKILLKTLDGGATWTEITGFTAANVQWMDGGRAIAHDSRSFYSTDDSGDTWNPMGTAIGPTPVCPCRTTESFHFADPRTGFYTLDDGNIVRTTDGGTTWKTAETSLYHAEQNVPEFQDVHFPAPDTGYAVGDYEDKGVIFRTADGGRHWIEAGPQIRLPLRAVHFTRALHGVAAGGMTDTLGREHGILLRTTDGGATWQDKSEGVEGPLLALHFPTPRKGYAVGFRGAIRMTLDSGNTWTTLGSDTSIHLSAVHFLDENTGFVGGGRPDRPGFGRLFKTVDGGKTWSRIIFDPLDSLYSYSEAVTHILFPTPEVGYILRKGQLILKSMDGGGTWKPLLTPAIIHDLQFTGKDTGFAVGDSIFRTVDGGSTWTRLKPNFGVNSLTAASFADARTLYAVGPRAIVKAYDFQPVSIASIAAGKAPVRRQALELLPGRLGFNLPKRSRVTVLAFDLSGRMRARIHDGVLPAGDHHLTFPDSPCGASPCLVEFRSEGVHRGFLLKRRIR